MPSTPPPSVDLDLRLVRYFVAVAEHRHFGRAADALRIAQPSLSRQIRRLEQQVGARLLDRTPRGTRLTEAGEVFLPRARALLRAAAEAAAHARSAGESDVLTVGYTLGIIVTPAVRELRHRLPDADVRAVHLKWNEARDALLDHRVDAAVTRQPLRTQGLEVTPLYDEPRVLVVPLDHRLAGKESVTLDDLGDEPMPLVRDAAWNAYWRIDPRPDGRPAPGGPVVDELEDKFEVIADGRAVAIVPLPRTRTLRPDVTTVPLEDVGPTPVLLVTRAGDRRRLVTEFRRTARALLTGPA